MAVAALVLNWAIISFTHLKFKRSMKLENKIAKFPALFSPLSNYIVLTFYWHDFIYHVDSRL